MFTFPVGIFSGAVPFEDPTDIAGLAMWLDAGVGTWQDVGRTTPATDGNIVAYWDDQSGNGADASSVGTSPTYDASNADFNNGPALFTTGKSLSLALTLSAGSITFFIVMSPTSAAASQYILDSQTGRLVFAQGAGDGTANVGYYDGTWRKPAAGTTGKQILEFWLDADSSVGRVYRNGVQLGTDLSYTSKAIGGSTRIFSTYNAVSTTLSGHTAEMVLYSAALTDAQRTNVRSYLNDKHVIY